MSRRSHQAFSGMESDDYVAVDYEDVSMISKKAIRLSVDGEDVWVPRWAFMDEPPDIEETLGTCHIKARIALEKGLA